MGFGALFLAGVRSVFSLAFVIAIATYGVFVAQQSHLIGAVPLTYFHFGTVVVLFSLYACHYASFIRLPLVLVAELLLLVSVLTHTDEWGPYQANWSLQVFAHGAFIVSILWLVVFPSMENRRFSGPYEVARDEEAWQCAETGKLHFATVFVPLHPTVARRELPGWHSYFHWLPQQTALNFWKVVGQSRVVAALLRHIPITESWSMNELHRYNWYDGIKVSEDDRFDVVIFSHGFTGIPEIYSCFCEELASRGFVVFSLRHTDGSATVIGPEGEIVHEFRPLPKSLFDNQEYEFRSEQLVTRCEDVKAALDMLHTSSKWKDRVQVESVTLVGHSFGGATAVTSALRYENITLAISLDGWLFPLPLSYQDPAEPFEHRSALIFINSEHWQWQKNLDRIDLLVQRSRGHSVQCMLRGSTHHTFDEVPLFFGPWLARALGLVRELPAASGLDTVCRMLGEFVTRAQVSGDATAAENKAVLFRELARDSTWGRKLQFPSSNTKKTT